MSGQWSLNFSAKRSGVRPLAGAVALTWLSLQTCSLSELSYKFVGLTRSGQQRPQAGALQSASRYNLNSIALFNSRLLTPLCIQNSRSIILP